MDCNRVWLKGRISSKINENYANTTSVISFYLAMNRFYTDSNGNKIDEATFVPIEAWDVVAENFIKICKKGDTVIIDGRLKTDQWTTKTGEKRSKLKIIIETFKAVV